MELYKRRARYFLVETEEKVKEFNDGIKNITERLIKASEPMREAIKKVNDLTKGENQ